MKSNILFFIKLAVSFLPFVLFAFFNKKANVKKENRNRQYAMPVVAVIYCAVLLIFMQKISDFCMNLFLKTAVLFDKIELYAVGEFIRNLYTSWGIYLILILFNTAALLFYVIIKRILTLIMGKIKVNKNTFIGAVVEVFYTYDETDDQWYIKNHFGQARTFIKAAYYGGCFVSGLALLVSCILCMNNLISAPFYPVFAVIIIGEMAFFIDGVEKEKQKSSLSVQTDNSRHIAMYPLLRKPLKDLFGDKLAADGTTVNNGGVIGGAIEDILVDIEKEGNHISRNYASFIRKKMEKGLKPNVNYVRCGYDLAAGKSLLFNTPFYDKLTPYVFYAMNRELLTGKKVLIVLGRHGTEEDLKQWAKSGMKEVSNIPDLWKIDTLTNKKINEDELPDIGIISRSGVHDLSIHKNNLPFLRKVCFVIIIEPSRLVTTAQIGLNLLIKCCDNTNPITFCSVDRNCDGLVDALSHILMTGITEVSATEYPRGISSYMYWTSDDDYLQHRILPGVSRCLGMGTELSMVALKNQVKKTVWYGEETFPVLDAHWIAKQYYYELLDYAQLPTNQETFDNCFQTSFNMCNERVNDYSFITVEDDRNNLFETRRNFATIAEKQGFVNVISSEYMLREYMSENTEIFTADPKAIPYITADFARSKRNAILSLCLRLCIDSVREEDLCRQMVLLNIDTNSPVEEIWKEVCTIFGTDDIADKKGNPVLSVKDRDGKRISFERDETILFKRAYNIEKGMFESVYTIENDAFSSIILDDLQNASYIAEVESKDIYIGTELKGHVYQKYMPGQFFTLNGKYYEMISAVTGRQILVRRASEHIGSRLAYRQIRNYTINQIEDSPSIGDLKSVNDIKIHYQFADFEVETPGYWKLHAYNDFDNGVLVNVNGVPNRRYRHKQLLKLDFSAFGDKFTDSVRMTLTNLLNEVFVTLFADNQAFISAITPGKYDAPLTYSLELADGIEDVDKCIFIIEDSQLDIGLLIAVERNINRIFQIISDYLNWNDEQIEESIHQQNAPVKEKSSDSFDIYAEDESESKKKKNFFRRIGDWFKKLFKKNKDGTSVPEDKPESNEGLTERQKKKAEKAAKKAEKEEIKRQKKEQKQAERLRKKQQKAEEKKAAESIPVEKVSTESPDEISEEEKPSVPDEVATEDMSSATEAEITVPEEAETVETSAAEEETIDPAEVETADMPCSSEVISDERKSTEELSEEETTKEIPSEKEEEVKP